MEFICNVFILQNQSRSELNTCVCVRVCSIQNRDYGKTYQLQKLVYLLGNITSLCECFVDYVSVFIGLTVKYIITDSFSLLLFVHGCSRGGAKLVQPSLRLCYVAKVGFSSKDISSSLLDECMARKENHVLACRWVVLKHERRETLFNRQDLLCCDWNPRLLQIFVFQLRRTYFIPTNPILFVVKGSNHTDRCFRNCCGDQYATPVLHEVSAHLSTNICINATVVDLRKLSGFASLRVAWSSDSSSSYHGRGFCGVPTTVCIISELVVR